MSDGKRARRRKVRRFTAPRRAEFLEHLRRTGNYHAAAAAVGLNRTSAEQRRKRDAEFAIACSEALAEANRRLAGAESALDCPGQGEFNVIKRSRNGRMQIIRAGAKRWSREVEERFFAALAMCGNISAAARAVGFSLSCIWKRRRDWPAFRQRMEEVLDEAEVALEFRIACMGSELEVGIDCESVIARSDSDAAIQPGLLRSARNDEDRRLPAIPFDPDFALRFLKWREEKRRGGGRRGRLPAPPPIEEVTERIVKRVEAIKKHRKGNGDSHE